MTYVWRICYPVLLSLSLLTHSKGHSTQESLLYSVYGDVFKFRDGSDLGVGGSNAVDAMQGAVQRLLAVGPDADILNVAKSLPDEDLMRILFLAVVGNFTTDQSPSALPQKCALVVDPRSGEFVMKDAGSTQSVILEVLLIVSIVCLLRAWKGTS
jgi:hypothetical protein